MDEGVAFQKQHSPTHNPPDKSWWNVIITQTGSKDALAALEKLKTQNQATMSTFVDAVKAQMEDSSLKVELAEQEMRRAVQSMRDEQRATGAQAGVRQRSLADMQELIHGLRNEQQQAKSALHACQLALRQARAVLQCCQH